MTPEEILSRFWLQVEDRDFEEGKMAYIRYNTTMQNFADHYNFPVERVTEVFAALSPNNDYKGNLRSMASVLDGFDQRISPKMITVSTYNACRDRAYKYLTGESDFDRDVKGQKITSFKDNILRPLTSNRVTIDGHMIAVYHDKLLTMTEASRLMKSRKQYFELESFFREFALTQGLIPNAVQAIIWFTRKRVHNVKYQAQLNLFASSNDVWQTECSPEDFPPFQLKRAT